MDQNLAPAIGGYFNRLRTCAVISLVLLIIATIFDLPPWAAMTGGVVPLFYYHLGYLWPRAKSGLSQAAIDSVYYFGFLVTIAALGVSAVSLAANEGKVPLESVAYQFGLGLLATGYAVLARMHLTSISTWIDEASPEAILDRYVARSRELVTNVELASTQFVQLADNLSAKSKQVAEDAQASTQQAMLALAQSFDTQLNNTLSVARNGLVEIHGLMSEVAFVKERDALSRGLSTTLNAVTELNKGLIEFSARAKLGAITSQDLSAKNVELSKSLNMVHEKLDKLSATNGTLDLTENAFQRAQQSLQGGAQAMAAATTELEFVTGSLSALGETHGSLKSLASKAEIQMMALGSAAERLEQSSIQMEKSADATATLAAALDRLVIALPALGERAESLDTRFTKLIQTAGGLQHRLGALPEPVGNIVALGVQVQETLQAVSKELAAATSNSAALANHTRQQLQALEHASKATAEVNSLKKTTDSIQTMLVNIGVAVEKMESSLSSATVQLNTSVVTASAMLDGEVKRSATTARMFSERLSDVAQIIIDQTRKGSAG